LIIQFDRLTRRKQEITLERQKDILLDELREAQIAVRQRKSSDNLIWLQGVKLRLRNLRNAA
jgi:hypothetical protein